MLDVQRIGIAREWDEWFQAAGVTAQPAEAGPASGLGRPVAGGGPAPWPTHGARPWASPICRPAREAGRRAV
ncbi:hypothetical protein ACRAWD_23670 [Caulobacter segnis]